MSCAGQQKLNPPEYYYRLCTAGLRSKSLLELTPGVFCLLVYVTYTIPRINLSRDFERNPGLRSKTLLRVVELTLTPFQNVK